jgi:hypothetical protein
MIGFVVSQEECECGCHYEKPADELGLSGPHGMYKTEHCILKRIFNSVKRFNVHSSTGV